MVTSAKTKQPMKSPRATVSRLPHKSSANKTSPRSTTPDRQRMIEEAAYFRAEKRGFTGQHEMDDWLSAETEIDQAFGK